MAVEGYLESSSPWDLAEDGRVWVLVGNQVAIQVVVQVRLGNLVSHGDCTRNKFNNRAGH